MTTKQCSKCGETKELNEYHKQRTGKYGRTAACKDCEKKRKAKSYGSVVHKGRRLNNETHKWCPTCSQLLLREGNFYKNRTTKDGLRSECKRCHSNREVNKRANNPAHKLRTNVSRSIRGMLSGRHKVASCLAYLPYSLEQLREHIENQFDDKMSWENYGSYWDLDHIYPHSKLPYDSMEHPNFEKCWGLENLQPLEKLENIKKSNKVD